MAQLARSPLVRSGRSGQAARPFEHPRQSGPHCLKRGRRRTHCGPSRSAAHAPSPPYWGRRPPSLHPQGTHRPCRGFRRQPHPGRAERLPAPQRIGLRRVGRRSFKHRPFSGRRLCPSRSGPRTRAPPRSGGRRRSHDRRYGLRSPHRRGRVGRRRTAGHQRQRNGHRRKRRRPAPRRGRCLPRPGRITRMGLGRRRRGRSRRARRGERPGARAGAPRPARASRAHPPPKYLRTGTRRNRPRTRPLSVAFCGGPRFARRHRPPNPCAHGGNGSGMQP